MKKIITLVVGMIFFLSLSVPAAYAGAKQRHRWQGVVMGLGAAILGSAIINSSRDSSPPERVVVMDRDTCGPRHYDHHPRGYWEVQKKWVEPQYEHVWNPPHYNQYHQWVGGRYITIEKQPGYWVKERVWVSCR